tara:strand:+ start:327 stop:548 length:222 start_codon:yes stop_codon:yes gene_type:complete
MRIMEIITTELALDKLKSEENLQNIINSNEYTSEIKVTKIKDELEKIVVANNMIDTWIKYIGTDKSNNNNNEQ